MLFLGTLKIKIQISGFLGISILNLELFFDQGSYLSWNYSYSCIYGNPENENLIFYNKLHQNLYTTTNFPSKYSGYKNNFPYSKMTALWENNSRPLKIIFIPWVFRWKIGEGLWVLVKFIVKNQTFIFKVAIYVKIWLILTQIGTLIK